MPGLVSHVLNGRIICRARDKVVLHSFVFVFLVARLLLNLSPLQPSFASPLPVYSYLPTVLLAGQDEEC